VLSGLKPKQTKKTMKQWMIGAMLLTCISLGAAAQGERKMPSPEERAQRMTDRLASELSLSEEQKQKILAINLENAKKRSAEMEKQRAQMEARRGEMKAQDEQIQAILTEDQRKKWEEIKMNRRQEGRPEGRVEDRRDMHRGGRPHRGGNR
jgi:Spy/CpxP family protein refolding chaperone